MSIQLAAFLLVSAASGSARIDMPNATVQPATPEPAAKAVEKQYCVRTTTTGSRMQQKLCRTRKAWLAQGFDPLSPNN